jgi:hypothetical protein
MALGDCTNKMAGHRIIDRLKQLCQHRGAGIGTGASLAPGAPERWEGLRCCDVTAAARRWSGALEGW